MNGQNQTQYQEQTGSNLFSTGGFNSSQQHILLNQENQIERHYPLIYTHQKLNLNNVCNSSIDVELPPICFLNNERCGMNTPASEQLLIGGMCETHKSDSCNVEYNLFRKYNKAILSPISKTSISVGQCPMFPILVAQPIKTSAKTFMNLFSNNNRKFMDSSKLATLFEYSTYPDNMTSTDKLKLFIKHVLDHGLTWTSVLDLACIEKAKVNMFFDEEYLNLDSVNANKWVYEMKQKHLVTDIVIEQKKLKHFVVPLVDFPIFDILTILSYLPSSDINTNSIGYVANIEIFNSNLVYGTGFGLRHDLSSVESVELDNRYPKDVQAIVNSKPLHQNVDILRLNYMGVEGLKIPITRRKINNQCSEFIPTLL